VIALVVSFVPGCGGTAASSSTTTTTTTPQIPATTVACSTAGSLATWSVRRLAEQTLVPAGLATS
jgi:1-aminocyclopropane-1-carboxylate deaminase/D-cysteine desulfhydrase-like pyridoxal-dependent ACC family enzyme